MILFFLNIKLEVIISEPGKGSTFFFTIETEYENGEKLHNGIDTIKMIREKLNLHFKEISFEWEQIQLIIKNVQI